MPQAASARLALVAPTSGDSINLWPGQIQAIRDRLEAVAAMYRIDVAANRPAASSVNAGMFFIATDTGAVSVSTGTSWVTVNPADTLALSLNNATALRLTGAAGGITFGGDSTLFRRGANQLGSGGGLVAGVGAATTIDAFATLPTGNTVFPYAVTNAGRVRWSSGAAAFDTELFRDGAGILSLTGEFRSSGRYIVGLGTANEVRVGNGMAGLQFGSANDTNLFRDSADVLKTDDSLYVGGTQLQMIGGGTIYSRNLASTSSSAILIRAAADTVDRFHVLGSGTIEWGPGNAVRDTNLYRSAADTLKTDDNFNASGSIVAAVGQTAQTFLGAASGSNPGILFGTSQDTNLYRSAADTLKTDDFLVVGQNITVQGGQIYFGTGDTNLYRSAADTLKTDDNFVTAGGITATSDVVATSGRIAGNATGATSSSTSGGTNALRSPKHTISAFIGPDESTAAYTASEASGALRFNGAGVYWGDVAYYPNGGGSTNPGHFRFSIAGTALVTTPNARVGVGSLHVEGSASTGIYFGAAQDTNLYRSASDVLKTDDAFQAVRVSAIAAAGGNSAISAFIAGEALPRLDIYGDGVMRWSPGSGTWDTNLYRSAADTLKTDDGFHCNDLTAKSGQATQVRLTDVTPSGGGANVPAVVFGSALDTNLYRSAANTLKTDDTFHAAGNLLLADGLYGIGGVAPGTLQYDSAGDHIFRIGSTERARVSSAGQTNVNGTIVSTGVESLRVIRGEFDGVAMTITSGSGFTIARTPSGATVADYTVTFNTAFAGRPTVTANNDATSLATGVSLPTTTSVRIRPEGSSDRLIHFIAVGPR